MNIFNRPPFNKLIKKTETVPAESPSQESVPAPEELTGHGIAWKSLLTFFLAGTLSLEAAAKPELSLTESQRKEAVEYIQKSSENILKYEETILKKAEHVQAHKETTFNDNGKKIKFADKSFTVDDTTATFIEYQDDAPISVSVRKTLNHGTSKEMKIIVSDGSGFEKRDGKADHVTIINSDGSKKQYGFVEVVDEKGDILIEITGGIKMDRGGANTAFLNAQKTLEKTMEAVVSSK